MKQPKEGSVVELPLLLGRKFRKEEEKARAGKSNGRAGE